MPYLMPLHIGACAEQMPNVLDSASVDPLFKQIVLEELFEFCMLEHFSAFRNSATVIKCLRNNRQFGIFFSRR